MIFERGWARGAASGVDPRIFERWGGGGVPYCKIVRSRSSNVL